MGFGDGKFKESFFFFLTEKVIARRGEEREGERDGTYRKKETEREATLKESMDIVSDLVI